MPQYSNNYNNYGNQNTSCNTVNCRKCRNKFGCSKYLTYLEDIVSSPVPSSTNQSIDSNTLSLDSTEQISPTFETSDSITDSNTEQIETTTISSSNIDINLTAITQSNRELKDSMVEVVLNQFLILDNQYRNLKESNVGLVKTLSGINDSIESFDEKFSKLDRLVSMIDSYNAQNNPENDGLTVYNGESVSDKVLVEKKGLFGKTRWVEEDNK